MGLQKVLFGKISNKLIFVFGVIFIALLVFSSLTLYFQEQVLEQQFLGAIIETEEDYFDIQEEGTRTLSAALEVVLQDPGFKKIYLEKDREKLFEYGAPLFQKLKDNYHITHFYFILPDGTNFVRLHNKDVYGDKINRITFQKAKFTGNVGAGIELGQTAYALRVVKPYYDGDKLIGYVELGQEIDEFLKIMKKGGGKEFSLLVDKLSLDEEKWKSVRENKGLRDNWDDLEGYVIIESTTEETFSCFSDEGVDTLLEKTSLIGESTIGNQTFACGGFALIDASEEKIGIIFSLIDVTTEQNLTATMRRLVLFMLIIYVAIFASAGFYVSRKISSPIRQLYSSARKLGVGDFKSRVSIKTGDELEQLGKSFNKTAEALEKMDQEHKQLDHVKTEFLSITSHELRSPMTPMRAQLQMLLKGYFGKISAKQKESIEIVLRNTERLDRIIQDFLEISRIEAARLKFTFVKVNLKESFESLIDEMNGFLPEKKIKLDLRMDRLPTFEVDPDRVGQVLRNLVNNAKKFSPNGSKIVIDVKNRDTDLLISVKDNGIGMSKEDQIRVFEPFYQAEQTMYRQYGGTGLGLAICKGIIESQNGRIWLESEKEKGTTFYFTVPFEPLKEIAPIKVLFSQKGKIEGEIKSLMNSILGPLSNKEFDTLKNLGKLNEEDLVEYIRILLKSKIISKENAKLFENKIKELFDGGGEKDLKKASNIFKKESTKLGNKKKDDSK